MWQNEQEIRRWRYLRDQEYVFIIIRFNLKRIWVVLTFPVRLNSQPQMLFWTISPNKTDLTARVGTFWNCFLQYHNTGMKSMQKLMFPILLYSSWHIFESPQKVWKNGNLNVFIACFLARLELVDDRPFYLNNLLTRSSIIFLYTFQNHFLRQFKEVWRSLPVRVL